jgi:hypothetical protein
LLRIEASGLSSDANPQQPYSTTLGVGLSTSPVSPSLNTLDKGKPYTEDDLFHPPGFGPIPNYTQVDSGPLQLAHQLPSLLGISHPIGLVSQALSEPYVHAVYSETLPIHNSPQFPIISSSPSPPHLARPLPHLNLRLITFLPPPPFQVSQEPNPFDAPPTYSHPSLISPHRKSSPSCRAPPCHHPYPPKTQISEIRGRAPLPHKRVKINNNSRIKSIHNSRINILCVRKNYTIGLRGSLKLQNTLCDIKK